MLYQEQNRLIKLTALERLHPKFALACWLALILGLGTGMAFLFGPDAWFNALVKPSWNPPAWLFAAISIMLYIMMGLGVWLIRRDIHAARADMSSAMTLFWLQFALNLAWTPIFFGLHNVLFAFIEICLLWMAALSTALAFGKISNAAGYLFVPYLMWLSFALILNGTVWLLNS